MANEFKRKKGLTLINFNKDGPGVEKDDETLSGAPYTLKRGARLFRSKFWKLISLNLMFMFMIIPLILIVYFYFTGPQTPTRETILFGPLAGIAVFEGHQSMAINTVFNFHAHIYGVPYTDLLQFVKISLPTLFLFVTLGWQNCGVTYITRSMINGDPVFIWSDYFYAIRKNLKQGFLVGVLDFFVIFALGFDYLYFNDNTGNFTNDFMFFVIIALAIIYLFMRFYLYLIVVTFDMNTKKILKNCLIFSVLGIKRNLMSVLLIIAYVLCFALLYMLLMSFNFGVTAVLLCFLSVFAVGTFITTYSAYGVIDKYMIIKDSE